MNYRLLVDTAMLTGEIMLIGGAETYRVEDTMCRILKISGLEKTETFVTPTGIFLTLGDSNLDAITVVRRVDNRITNISNIYEANNISRNLCDGTITLEEAYEALKGIKNQKQYNRIINYICTMIASLSFTILLGGDWFNSIIAGLNGGLIVVVLIITKNLKINTFIKNLVSSILIAFNSMMFLHYYGAAIQLDTLIGGSVMPLLPGVAITNAIRDTLQGDYMSGGARAIEAFVSATSTAAGIGIGIAFYSFMSGGILL
ncbi:threonine/serine exporter family protein [Anaerocolumna sp. AGMB13025]|uniref:threonine/serine exporter family protein n=1 Tax=Anaerocolumna sp. AGMB13025 TaxID=3039116 RepID=UPI00241F9E3C|nr:threonine/serine exporter family protein [Anaerocolumna sp. AGMB13025]WFR59696.1 threonine/serine exporter family protein [Anaerocolumna sp. AGMB13025]